jgi:hypothetical protein
VHDLAIARHQGAGDDLVLGVDLHRLGLLVDQQAHEAQDIACKEIACALGQPPRHVGMANDRYAVLLHNTVVLGELAVAALFDGKIDNHRARLHGLDHVRGNKFRCGTPRDQRGGDHHVLLLDRLGDERGLLLLVFRAHFLGVAAGGFGLFEFLVLHRDKGATEAFDLLLRGRPHVGGRNHRTQAPRRGNRLQTGDPRAHHQHTRRRDGAGRGHHHRERPAKGGGAVQHRTISGKIRLRGQHVHRLCPSDPRDQLQRKPRDPGRRHCTDEFRFGQRAHQADQGLPLREDGHFIVAFAGDHRPLDLDHDICARGGRFRILADRGACLLVGGVGERGCLAGSALDHHVKPHGNHLADGLGRSGNARLVRAPLLQYGDLH